MLHIDRQDISSGIIPHVFHFSGHGGFEERRDCLLVEQPQVVRLRLSTNRIVCAGRLGTGFTVDVLNLEAALRHLFAFLPRNG